MKKLRSLSAAFVLTLILALPAFAGHIHTGITCTDPEHSPTSLSATTIPETDSSGELGHIHTGDSSTDLLTQATLDLLLDVLSLF